MSLHPNHDADFETALVTERRRRARLALGLAASEQARRLALERSRLYPEWWAQNFLWSVDPRRPPGQTDTPLTLWDWQARFFLFVLGRGEGARDKRGRLRPIVCDKGRDLGLTYVVLAALLWSWIFESGVSYGLISRTGAEVWNGTERSLFGKLLHMLERLPSWMRPRYDFSRSSPQTLTNLENGNVIIGTKSTPNAFHSERHTRIFGDEWSRVLHAEEAIRGIDGATDAPIIVSTPRGMGNHFARLVHGKAGAVVQPGDTAPGWVHFRFKYHLDPRKDEEWIEKTKASMTPQAWAEQHECDYSGSAVGRIWPEFRRDLHLFDSEEWDAPTGERSLWRCNPTIIEAWDFGSGASLTAVVWAAHVEATDTLYLLDYREWHAQPYDVVARDVGAAGWHCNANRGGIRPDHRVGDIAGKARDSAQRSWISNLAEEGIKISGQSMTGGGIEYAISTVRKALRDERILLSPEMAKHHTRGLPSGVEVFEQYRRDGKSANPDTHVGSDQKPRKDVYSHLADAIQHAAIKAWPRMSTGATLQDGATW